MHLPCLQVGQRDQIVELWEPVYCVLPAETEDVTEEATEETAGETAEETAEE